MEDNFRVRLDKAFGSLSTTATPSSSSLSSLWSLTDDEIERNQWIRDKDSPEPEPEPEPDHPLYSFNGDDDYRTEMEKDLEDLEDEEHAAVIPKKPDGYNDEEWEIKSSIGLDSTLDHEEEEDEYDKVAVGREKVEVGLYMKDINDYETDADACNELPNSVKEFTRDPRANHIAAKIRLKEDAEAAKRIDSLRVSEKEAPPMIARVNVYEDGNLKSILKRKDNQSDSKESQPDSKSQKRVRFDAECKNDSDEESEGDKDIPMESGSTEEAVVSNDSYILPPDYPSGIPDYMRNPTKYTRYTFDSSNMNEESNRQAYMDFLKLLKRSNATESHSDDAFVDLPKSVTFVPKRKTNDSTMVENCGDSKHNLDDAGKEPTHRRNLRIGIAAGNSEDDEVCVMEEDEPETIADKRNSLQKSGRQYRMKSSMESDELS